MRFQIMLTILCLFIVVACSEKKFEGSDEWKSYKQECENTLKTDNDCEVAGQRHWQPNTNEATWGCQPTLKPSGTTCNSTWVCGEMTGLCNDKGSCVVKPKYCDDNNLCTEDQCIEVGVGPSHIDHSYLNGREVYDQYEGRCEHKPAPNGQPCHNGGFCRAGLCLKEEPDGTLRSLHHDL